MPQMNVLGSLPPHVSFAEFRQLAQQSDCVSPSAVVCRRVLTPGQVKVQAQLSDGRTPRTRATPTPRVTLGDCLSSFMPNSQEKREEFPLQPMSTNVPRSHRTQRDGHHVVHVHREAVHPPNRRGLAFGIEEMEL